MSDNAPRVFVDDSDPSIIYRGQDAWAVQTGISTAPQPATLPGRAPYYGTIHQVKGNGSFSFIFNGTSAIAIFNSEYKTFMSSCLIDGGKADFLDDAYQAYCSATVPDGGQHNLTVSVTLATLFQDDGAGGRGPPIVLPNFDGIFYTPSDISRLQEVDVSYQGILPTGGNVSSAGEPYSLSVPGDGIDFEFDALYVGYENGNNVPVNLSYKVDDGLSMNFTLTNPSSNFSASDELILQTPQYAQGKHRFHLDFLGPSSQSQMLMIENIIVQNNPNTQKLVALQVFPPLQGNITSTAQQPTGNATGAPQTDSTSHRIGQGSIIAISVTLTAALVILTSTLMVIRQRSRRRNSTTNNTRDSDGSEETVTPFIPGIFARRLVYPSSKRMLDSMPDLPRVAATVSKVNRLVPPSHDATRAAALPDPIPVSTPTPALTRTPIAVPVPTAPPALPAAQDGTEEPIYRIHEDGGSVHEASSTAPGQRQVIDLPPLYSSNFGRRQETPEEPNAGG
ncbi:hypothetical protein CPC08DRAFT_751988 [Agrocybe pediades]|nr:hypothetical protein CPC08DRAFT_751988 [Agrocybe pediades]